MSERKENYRFKGMEKIADELSNEYFWERVQKEYGGAIPLLDEDITFVPPPTPVDRKELDAMVAALASLFPGKESTQ